MNNENGDKDNISYKSIPNLQTIIKITCIIMSCFQIYTAYFGVFAAWKQRSIHLCFVLLIVYLIMLNESNISLRNNKNRKNVLIFLLNWIFLGANIYITYYIVFGYQEIIMRGGSPNFNDQVVGSILIVLILLAVFKKVSPSLFAISFLFLIYSIYGHMLSGKLSSPFFTYSKVIDQLFNSTGGIFGIPLGVSATDISMFIIFGAFLSKAGATNTFNNIANLLVRNIKGGASKAVIITNALVGTTQGSAVSVIGTTGTFCIPYLKDSGYNSDYTGAILASSATGAMLMPPVMGAAAFLLASITLTPYANVIMHGIFPAILFYLGILFMTHFHYEKNKSSLKDLKKTKPVTINKEFWLNNILVFLPLAVLIGALVIKKFSPMRSAFYALIALTIIWSLRKRDRLTIKSLLEALEKGAKGVLIVGLACGCAGIIIGTLSLTGVGAKISAIVAIFGVSQIVILILTMVVCIILGMGVPPAASYIIAAGMLGGILLRSGIPLIVGHFFIFYFATMAPITPPVALASYAAAGMAKASANRVGFLAWKLALPGFIIPFAFVYNNSILLMGSNFFNIFITLIFLITAVFILSMALEGWFIEVLSKFERISLFLIVLILLVPKITINLIGIFFFALIIIHKYNKNKKHNIIKKKGE